MEQNSGIEPRLFSVLEAARYLGVSRWTVRELPSVRIGRRLLVDLLDLDAFLRRVKIQRPS